MFELTIRFETKDELIAYLGDAPKILAPVVELPAAPNKEERAERSKARREEKKIVAAAVASAQPEVASNAGSVGPEPSHAPSLPGADTGTAVDSASASTGNGAGNVEVEAAPVTIDDVRAALADVNAKKGIQHARELLAKFSAGRISDLKPEQYGTFLKFAKSEI